MNYLPCNHCGFKHLITHHRMVFCKQCSKKITHNYLDWKKSTVDPSFENYLYHVPLLHPDDETIQVNSRKKQDSFITAFPKRKLSKKTTLFLSATLIQLILFICLLFDQQGTPDPGKESPPDKTYLSEVSWHKHSISEDISLLLPFKLKPCESILPVYLQHYVDLENSQKGEASPSFSVTIDTFETEQYAFDHTLLLSLKDAYLSSSDASLITKSETEHMTIKNYHMSSQHGSYSLHGTNYLYDNYILVNGKWKVKIMVSYLKQDPLLCDYADVISKSLYSNKLI